MKTFEEKWTAWVDGELSDAERAEFEASLDDRVAAEAEKNQAHKLGALLREQLQPRAKGNEEFFHHQLRGRIAAEMKESVPRRATAARESWWTIRRLLWTGARKTDALPVAILEADLKCPRRSERKSVRDGLDFPNQTGSRYRPLGRRLEITAAGIRNQITDVLSTRRFRCWVGTILRRHSRRAC